MNEPYLSIVSALIVGIIFLAWFIFSRIDKLKSKINKTNNKKEKK